MNERILQEAQDLAVSLADEARAIASSLFRQPLLVEFKSDLSPVTIADRRIESVLKERIRVRFPDHDVYGEETGGGHDGVYTWVIDPIDGTKSFASGNPLFGTLIGLVVKGAPVLGLIDAAAMNERWIGAPGRTLFQGEPAAVSRCTELGRSRMYTTSQDYFAGASRAAFERLREKAAFVRYGGDCYAFGLLASGHCDLVVEFGLKPYDYLPVVPVVTGAGGCITDWQGQALTFQSDGSLVAASSPALLAEALSVLQGL